MLRKFVAATALTAGLAAGTGPALAHNVNRPVRPGPFHCVGATQHKSAQQLRVQVLQSERAAFGARLAAAQAANNPQAVVRITGHIARLDARIADVHANIAQYATRCP